MADRGFQHIGDIARGLMFETRIKACARHMDEAKRELLAFSRTGNLIHLVHYERHAEQAQHLAHWSAFDGGLPSC